MGADELDTSKLAKAFVIYQGSHGDEGVKNADVILPGVAYTEKPGTYLNIEGRVQIALRAIFGPGEAREDWTILRALSDVLGKTLSYDTIAELRAKMVKDHPHFAVVDQKPTADWSDIGVEGDIEDTGFQMAIKDFYGTNPIARSSETMAECRAALNGEDYIEGATGT
jgi:NADH-quinone oxidoreductase subunit G